MKCLGLVDSGNYALYLQSVFERKGVLLNVVPTPCSIAFSGCGYCLEFPEEYAEAVLRESINLGMPLRLIYHEVQSGGRVRYLRRQ